jgi:peptidoglycan/xylan/chitin deacetylase (PgdA/CDA1 family)
MAADPARRVRERHDDTHKYADGVPGHVPMATPRAALSVDLEFFSHIPAYRNASESAGRDAVGLSQVAWLRDQFTAHDALSTFFTVSGVAESYPDEIAPLADDGHEIASHTHTHRHLSEISAADRQEELVESKRLLEEICDTEVRGFRAPSFDIADDHFEMLADAGYGYDSSLVPCRSIPGWYGGEHDAERPCRASAVDANAPADLAEVPVSVMPGLRLPLTGTWIRFFGVHYTLLGMRWLARRGIAPVLYVHPWELADLPAVDDVPRRVYVRTGAYMRRAIERILAADFEFVTVGELAADATAVGTGTERSNVSAEREGDP